MSAIWRTCDAVPYKVPLQWSKLDVPYGCPSNEKGAVMKCPLCRPYITVSQRVMPFPVGKMGCSAVRNHDECPNRCPSNGEVPLQWIKCDAARGSALKRWVQSCNSEEIRIKGSPLTACDILACLAERGNRWRETDRWTDIDRD